MNRQDRVQLLTTGLVIGMLLASIGLFFLFKTVNLNGVAFIIVCFLVMQLLIIPQTVIKLRKFLNIDTPLAIAMLPHFNEKLLMRTSMSSIYSLTRFISYIFIIFWVFYPIDFIHSIFGESSVFVLQKITGWVGFVLFAVSCIVRGVEYTRVYNAMVDVEFGKIDRKSKRQLLGTGLLRSAYRVLLFIPGARIVPLIVIWNGLHKVVDLENRNIEEENETRLREV